MSLTLIPAYGRDYKSIKAVKQDWEAGKDFQIQDISSSWNGSYTSIKDIHPEVKIRYYKLTKVVIISGKQNDN